MCAHVKSRVRVAACHVIELRGFRNHHATLFSIEITYL